MATLMQWQRQHENDVRQLLPKVVEQVAIRRQFSEDYGKRSAKRLLDDANEQHLANVRRTRAVLMGLATIRERLETDPNYTAQRANSDAATLRREYQRLRDDLPRLALKLEDARTVDADPVAYAERTFEKYPALADRLPGLPVF